MTTSTSSMDPIAMVVAAVLTIPMGALWATLLRRVIGRAA
jgi:hypothetical protein